jgi:RNA polymerase sigma-70 factor (ECF subfamily)
VQGDHHAGELDELTFRRAQRGDEEACRALVARYQRPLFRLLWRMLEQESDRQTVEDLTQETFLRVFDALERFSYQGPARLSTWILTIGTRLALNEARRRSRSPVVPVAEPDAGVPAAQQADETLRRRRLGRAIRQALAQLPPEARAVLVLREYHELEYAEIARACGIEAGTVKSRLSRARAAMRRSLSEVRDDV